MDRELALQWVNKRLASREYATFLLADVFYDGYFIPEEFISPFKSPFNMDTMYLSDIPQLCFEPLIYNPLEQAVKKKKNYLLSRPYTVIGAKEVRQYLEDNVALLKTVVSELYKKGEVWLEFEPDTTSPIKFKLTVRKAETIVPHYTNVEQTEYDAVGYLWNKVTEDNKVQKFVDFVTLEDRFRVSLTEDSPVQTFGHAVRAGNRVKFKSLPFIKLTIEGLYYKISRLGKMYSDRYAQADSLLEDNADPVAVIKNASGTDDETLMSDIKENKVVKVTGTGDFSYASKSMDYSSLENFMKYIKSDIYDLCGIVSRESELSYVTSGRAIDRLYIEMDSDASDMGDVLRDALKSFLTFVSQETGKDYIKDFDIVFNTDKPTDEQQIIQNITSSQGLLSKRTLLTQHPWVKDVDKELKQIEEENNSQQSQEPPIQEQELPKEEEPVDEEEEKK